MLKHEDSQLKKISSIAVSVSDKDKAMKWYSEVLGMEVRENEGHWVTVGLSGDGISIHLCEDKELKPAPEGVNTGIAFSTDNVDKAYDALKSKGVEFSKLPNDEGFGMYCIFNDPDKNQFWVLGV